MENELLLLDEDVEIGLQVEQLLLSQLQDPHPDDTPEEREAFQIHISFCHNKPANGLPLPRIMLQELRIPNCQQGMSNEVRTEAA